MPGRQRRTMFSPTCISGLRLNNCRMKMQTNSRTTRIVIVGLLVVMRIIAGGLLMLRARSTSNTAAPPNQPVQLASFTENGVAVEIILKKDEGKQPALAGISTPTDEAFHLYSKDSPRGGIQ